jgi:antirestriction protein ArdC
MSKRSSSGLSETERDERRHADRERLKQAAQELLSSEGWQRWVRVRATFHTYSAGNCMLLALQCHQRGIEPHHVAGFRAWLNLGRCVRKGEAALRILAPVTVKQRDGQGEDRDERRVFFKTAFVFELSQTEPLPGVEPVPLNAPCEPLTGDSHTHLLAPLEAFAESLGYTVTYEVIPGSAGGWCDPARQRIVVDRQAAANARVRTLIHECAHALGVDYQHYTRAQAEVIVDTVTFLVSASVGLAVDGETIPYIAGWGEHGALEAVTQFAETIDTLARHIEQALSPSTNDQPAGEQA